MNFKTLFNDHFSDVSEVMAALRLDRKLWDAVEDGDLMEMGRILYKNLETRKKELEEGFDDEEAARDVIRESQKADAKEFNRKLN